MTAVLQQSIDYVAANGDLATRSLHQIGAWLPSLSQDGQLLAFSTVAGLVPGDTNGVADIYLMSFATGAVTLASTGSNGAPANGASLWATLSADGGTLLFGSAASNLVAGDTNGQVDVFIKDLDTGAVERVSTRSDGTQAHNGESAEARLSFSPAEENVVLFCSLASDLVPGDTNGDYDIFIKHLDTGAIQRVSVASDGVTQANHYSMYPSFSPDGTKVVFYSDASNLVPGDTNGVLDAFVKDLGSGVVTLVSTSSSGAQADGDTNDARFAPDGRFVYITSIASNLVPGDTNNRWDIFRKDLVTGEVSRVSVAADGTEATGGSGMPGDPWSSGSWLMDLSVDGRYLSFLSDATNLVPADTNGTFDVFVKDLATGAVARVSTEPTGTEANDFSFGGVLSGDGRYIVFESLASNLVPGDVNGKSDFFRVSNPFLATTYWVGDDGDNSHSGGDGNDVMLGMGGDDTLSGLGGADSLDGGDGSDELSGGTGDDSLLGGSGDDRLEGGSGSDTLVGGDGVDTAFFDLRMQSAGVTIDGSAVGKQPVVDLPDGLGGTDRLDSVEQLEIWGSIHADTFIGGSGNDTLWTAAGDDTADGGPGNDSVDGFRGNDSLLGGPGDDWLRGDAGNDTLLGGDGFDTAFEEFSQAATGVWYDGSAVGTAPVAEVHDGLGGTDQVGGIERLWIKGSPFDDRIDGGATADYLWGAAGNDTLDGGSASDTLQGADGDDLLIGGAGDDWLSGEAGSDTAVFRGLYDEYAVAYDSASQRFTVVDSMPGRDGTDRLDGVEFLQFLDATYPAGSLVPRQWAGDAQDNWYVGGAGSDTLHGLGGDDTVKGEGGADLIFGDDGADMLYGGTGHDVLHGGTGDDWLYGEDGNDTVDGGDGRDWVRGDAGDDSLSGGAGNDDLFGDAGSDTLAGGGGDDSIRGGEGIDTVVFSGPRAGYTVTPDVEHNCFVVADKLVGRDGADTVRDVEFLQFADGRVSVDPQALVDPGGLPDFIRGLDSGCHWGNAVGTGRTLSYAFATTPEDGMVNFNPYSPAQQKVVEQALDAFSAVAGVKFVPAASEASAQLRFYRCDLDRVGAANYPERGQVYINNSRPLTELAGTDAHTLLHEIGHALGMSHPFDDEYLWYEDQTVMSYAGKSSFGPYDLATLHYFFGPNPDEGSDSDIHGFEDGYVWDGHGAADIFSADLQPEPVHIDLAPGGWSWIGATKAADLMAPGQVFIGLGSWIEQAYGGLNDDVIAGNDRDNIIFGGPGRDTLSGAAGGDIFIGGPGDDWIDGGFDEDIAQYPGPRSDYLVVAQQNAAGVEYTVTDLNTADGDEGADSLSSIEMLQFDDGIVHLERSFSGTVIDGYVAGAEIFVDVDGDGVPDAVESTGMFTDASGRFAVTTPLYGRLLAVGGTSVDTNLPSTVVLSAPADSTVISPLTTVVQLVMDRQGSSPSVATGATRAALGISGDIDLTTYDPLARDDVAVQKVSSQLAVLAALGSAGGSALAEVAAAVVAAGTQVIDLASDAAVQGIVPGAPAPVVQRIADVNRALGQATNFAALSQAQGAGVNDSNDAPVLVAPIADQAAPLGLPYALDVSKAFADVDAGDHVTYGVAAVDGVMPAWLSFDAVTQCFSGTPDVPGSVVVRVTCSDASGLSTTDEFTVATHPRNLISVPFGLGTGQVDITLVADSVNGQPDPEPAGMATLRNVHQEDAPAILPTSLALPIDLIAFEATLSAVGKTENFSLLVNDLVPVDGYWERNAFGEWLNLAGSVVHAGGSTRVDFTVTDGGEFDADGLANGVIVGSGGLGSADRPVLDLRDKVLALYIAYFDRAPDAQGLQFWLDAAQNGLSLYDISAGFANHPRFAQEYGGLTHSQIAEKIYLNVLHRPGDADGIVFWTNQLDSRPASQIFVDFAIGALQVDLEGMYGRGELTAEEYAVAFERQKISENLMQASEHFLMLFGDATTPAAPPDEVATDPAYQAAIAVLDHVDSDLNLVFDQRDALVPLVGLPDAMEQIVDLLG